MKKKFTAWKDELQHHLDKELLPFWLDRLWDEEHGGFLTQWDKDGKDSGVDEKSMLAHFRSIYSLSLAALHGHDHDGRCQSLATKGVHFAIEHYWDEKYGGLYWLFDRKNNVLIDQKITYGHSFVIYALSTYTLAFGDPIGLEYAERVFDLLQVYVVDTNYGGYWTMLNRNWSLCGPGSAGGDRKTLDIHMHLMEAFTALYQASGKEIHRRKLLEIITQIDEKILHPEFKTGIPMFWEDWTIAPHIKFDIIWGWDRFEGEDGEKEHALDNTSYGHNAELFWLLAEALKSADVPLKAWEPTFRKMLDHSVAYGVDEKYGGVYVEGSLTTSAVHDKAKEFWQQAEFMIGMLDAYLLYGDERYIKAYENVHRFVFDVMINHDVGEWLPLLQQDGTPIWRHMSHSWKVNYHTIRAVVLSINRLERLME